MVELNPKRMEPGETRARRAIRSPIFWLLVGIVILAGVGILAFCWYAWSTLSFDRPPYTYSVALGDLDGDGDLDAFYANGEVEGPRPNTVLINQGGAQGGPAGEFHDSGQRLGKNSAGRLPWPISTAMATWMPGLPILAITPSFSTGEMGAFRPIPRTFSPAVPETPLGVRASGLRRWATWTATATWMP